VGAVDLFPSQSNPNSIAKKIQSTRRGGDDELGIIASPSRWGGEEAMSKQTLVASYKIPLLFLSLLPRNFGRDERDTNREIGNIHLFWTELPLQDRQG
jgi:hypothetical protein